MRARLSRLPFVDSLGSFSFQSLDPLSHSEPRVRGVQGLYPIYSEADFWDADRRDYFIHAGNLPDPYSSELGSVVQMGVDSIARPINYFVGAFFKFLRLSNVVDGEYIGKEFFHHNVPVTVVDEGCQLGGEFSALPFTYYVDRYPGTLRHGVTVNVTAIPSDAETGQTYESVFHDLPTLPYGNTSYLTSDSSSPFYISCVGHRFGLKDEDTIEMWNEIILFLRSEQLPSRLHDSDEKERARFMRRANQFFLHEQILFRYPNRSGTHPPLLVVVDPKRRLELMREAHDHSGHRGRNATYIKLKERYYWPNMFDSVAIFVRSCYECQVNSKRRPIIDFHVGWLTKPMKHWHLDTIQMTDGVLSNGTVVKYILSAVEGLMDWPEARAAPANTSENWARFIFEDIICRFGYVPIFTVDNGSEFKGVMEVLFARYGIHVVFSTSYHPEGNGVSERSHQPLRNGVLKCAGSEKRKWPQYLHAVLLAIRTTTSRTTGYSPYYILYGTQPIFAYEFEDTTWQSLAWHTVYDRDDLLALRALQIARRDEALLEITQKVRESRKRAIEDAQRKYPSRFDPDSLKEGDWVLLHQTWLDEVKGSKEEERWSGPFIVHMRTEHGAFILRELDGTIIRGPIHGSRLKIFYFRPDNPFPSRRGLVLPSDSAVDEAVYTRVVTYAYAFGRPGYFFSTPVDVPSFPSLAAEYFDLHWSAELCSQPGWPGFSHQKSTDNAVEELMRPKWERDEEQNYDLGRCIDGSPMDRHRIVQLHRQSACQSLALQFPHLLQYMSTSDVPNLKPRSSSEYSIYIEH